MNRAPQKAINRIGGIRASWLNCSEFIEPSIERVLTLFEVLGYTVLLQSDIVSGRHQAILQSYHNGILGDRFLQAMQRINPMASLQQIESILHQLRATLTMPLLQQNRQWHLQLLNGITVESSLCDLSKLTMLQLVDFSNLLNNDWLVIHSFPIIERDDQHCLDLVIFINGLPLAMFHGFYLGNETWSLRSACFQLQVYKTHLPKFFSLNELLVLSNGVQARIGTLATQWKQFTKIHAAQEEIPSFTGTPEIEILIHHVFNQQRFLEIIQHFIIFRQSRTTLTKKLRSHSFSSITFPKFAREMMTIEPAITFKKLEGFRTNL